MKIIAINGSPRKNKNTAILLKKALEGAESHGAKTELVHLYDLDYKGCISCFACKLKNGKSYGECALKDGLTPILEKVVDADAIILGSPIYFGSMTGAMHSFLERLLFPYLTYTEGYKSLFQRKLLIGCFYTMNVTSEQMSAMGYVEKLKFTESSLNNIFGHVESLFINDTYQFDDYSKYVSTVFDSDQKAKSREELFPADCKAAFEMGSRFAKQASAPNL